MKGYIYLLIIGFGCLIVYNLFLKDLSIREPYENQGSTEDEPTDTATGYNGNVAMYTDPASGKKSWASPLVYRINVVEDADSAQDRRNSAEDRGTVAQRCAQDKEFITTNKQGMDALEQRIKWGKQEMNRIQPIVDKNTKGVAMNKSILTNISKQTQQAANSAGKGADSLKKMSEPATPEPTKGGPMAKAIWLFSGAKKSA